MARDININVSVTSSSVNGTEGATAGRLQHAVPYIQLRMTLLYFYTLLLRWIGNILKQR